MQQTIASSPRPTNGSSAQPMHSSTLGAVSNVANLDLGTLMRLCDEESRLFYRHEEHDSRFAYELFRRALVDRNEQAWEHLYHHYFPLVEHWVRRTGAFTCSGESSEYFVTAAFTRFWKAISAERFGSFSTLAALLNYLRRCASCVVIDSVRSHNYNDLLPEESVNWQLQAKSSVDDEAIEQVSRVEFWNHISDLLASEAERVILHNSFVLGMKPGDIYNERGDLFASVDEVYAVKRNVLGRLRRSKELRHLYM